MKKNILLVILLTLTFTAQAREGHLNSYWFGDSIDKSANPNDNLDSIDSFLNSFSNLYVSGFKVVIDYINAVIFK